MLRLPGVCLIMTDMAGKAASTCASLTLFAAETTQCFRFHGAIESKGSVGNYQGEIILTMAGTVLPGQYLRSVHSRSTILSEKKPISFGRRKRRNISTTTERLRP
ncbi:hypothetical protein BDN67DRAFT_105412 [Paxillus ammoniavirescens]|nr:hypothetical protein BDN67DRAFT_105412 [Paxillus ammoniavirescens]